MNAKELMDRDLVRQKFSELQLRVHSVTPPYILAYGEDGRFHEDSIEPVPISPEVLVRSGFTLRFDGWLWCAEDGNEDQDYIFIQFRKGGEDGFGVRKCEINFFNKAQAVFRNIQYVHQLQQLLRLVGVDIIVRDKK